MTYLGSSAGRVNDCNDATLEGLHSGLGSVHDATSIRSQLGCTFPPVAVSNCDSDGGFVLSSFVLSLVGLYCGWPTCAAYTAFVPAIWIRESRTLSLAGLGRNGPSLVMHVCAHVFPCTLCQQVPINTMCKRFLSPNVSNDLTDKAVTVSLGAEYRVKTSCPSCGTVKSLSTSYKPCQDAVDRGVGVCKRVEGRSIDLKWLCGSPKCEELADKQWEEECHSRTLGQTEIEPQT
jgi:hypothetical protein